MTLLDTANQIQKAKQLLMQEEEQKNRLAQIGAEVLRQQQQSKMKQLLNQAHTVGINDGINAIISKINGKRIL